MGQSELDARGALHPFFVEAWSTECQTRDVNEISVHAWYKVLLLTEVSKTLKAL